MTHITDVSDSYVTVTANQENMIIKEKIKLPCLISMDSEVNTPRLPSYRRKLASSEECVKIMTLNDFEDTDSGHYGLKGSPTQVQKVFPPDKSTSRVLEEGRPEELSDKLHSLLADRKFI